MKSLLNCFLLLLLSTAAKSAAPSEETQVYNAVREHDNDKVRSILNAAVLFIEDAALFETAIVSENYDAIKYILDRDRFRSWEQLLKIAHQAVDSKAIGIIKDYRFRSQMTSSFSDFLPGTVMGEGSRKPRGREMSIGESSGKRAKVEQLPPATLTKEIDDLKALRIATIKNDVTAVEVLLGATANSNDQNVVLTAIYSLRYRSKKVYEYLKKRFPDLPAEIQKNRFAREEWIHLIRIENLIKQVQKSVPEEEDASDKLKGKRKEEDLNSDVGTQEPVAEKTRDSPEEKDGEQILAHSEVKKDDKYMVSVNGDIVPLVDITLVTIKR